MSFFDIMSLLGSLAVIVLVLVLTYYFTRWYARRMGGGTVGGKYIRVLEKSVMGTGTSLVVAQVGEKFYLLGVGDKTVTMLAELPDDFEEQAIPAQPAPSASFSQVLRQFTDRSRDTLSKKDDGGPNEGK